MVCRRSVPPTYAAHAPAPQLRPSIRAPPHQLDHLDALLSLHGRREHAPLCEAVRAEVAPVRPWSDGSCLAGLPRSCQKSLPPQHAGGEQKRQYGPSSGLDDETVTTLSSSLVIRRRGQQQQQRQRQLPSSAGVAQRSGAAAVLPSTSVAAPQERRRDCALRAEAEAIAQHTRHLTQERPRARASTEIFLAGVLHHERLCTARRGHGQGPAVAVAVAAGATAHSISRPATAVSRGRRSCTTAPSASPPSVAAAAAVGGCGGASAVATPLRRSASAARNRLPAVASVGVSAAPKDSRQRPPAPPVPADEDTPDALSSHAQRLRLMVHMARGRRERALEELEVILAQRNEILAALSAREREQVLAELAAVADAEGLSEPRLTQQQLAAAVAMASEQQQQQQQLSTTGEARPQQSLQHLERAPSATCSVERWVEDVTDLALSAGRLVVAPPIAP